MNIKFAIRIRLPDGRWGYRSASSSSHYDRWDNAQLWNNSKTVTKEVRRLVSGDPRATTWEDGGSVSANTTTAEVVMVKIGEPL